MSKHTHVWMLNMGGPDRPEAIQPFLQRLLNDPLVVPLPFLWLQAVFAWIVSRVRAPRLIPSYEKMGGASPQLAMVEDQARSLGRVLGQRYHCRPVLRYWGPTAPDAAQAVGPGDQIVLLSLYPQACQATTTSSIADARAALADKQVELAEVVSYPTDPGYVEAVAETVREAIADLPQGTDYQVVFSAHGVPERWVTQQGDPYQREVLATVAAVVKAVGLSHPHHVSYQSRMGRGRWLQPSTPDKIRELGSQGVQAVVIVPIAFTSEHLETRIELDDDLRQTAQDAGIRSFVRAHTVGLRPTFIRSLAELVRQAERAAGWEVPEDEVRRATQQKLDEEKAREQAAQEAAAAAQKAAEQERQRAAEREQQAAEGGPVIEHEDPEDEATELAGATPAQDGPGDDLAARIARAKRRPPGQRQAPVIHERSRLRQLADEADDEEEAATVLIGAVDQDMLDSMDQQE